MTKLTIDLELRLHPSAAWITPTWVKAEILPDLAPHLAMVSTWAVHKALGGAAWWGVSNVETGLGLTGLWSSRAECIEDARLRLSTETAKTIALAIDRAGSPL